MSKKYNIAVAGATGAVGLQVLQCLEERNFPVKQIKLLASSKSEGKELQFNGETIKVQTLKEDSFKDCEIAIFSAGGSTSKKFAPFAAKDKCIVIDNSNAWRMDENVPLVVPEVNPDDILKYKKKYIIANPNCSTIQMLVALYPIHKKYNIKRIVVSTYQAVSGTGKKAIDELFLQTKKIINDNVKEVEKNVYPHQIAFNCLPHIDVFGENGYSKEEMKMLNETRKIFNDNDIKLTATTVRVPVFYSHSESVNIETRMPIDAKEVKELLKQSDGIKLVDDPQNNIYPLAIESAGKDFVFVGRIRKDESIENGINMWIVADNIRKGAATNAVQIAELLINKYLN